MNRLSIVVPVYNEEQLLERSFIRLSNKLDFLIDRGLISEESNIVFVDDGSKDDSWGILERIQHDYLHVIAIKLTKNYGQQNAILAGLFTVDADFYITVDADLQDDLESIDKMIEMYLKGHEIVYGVRRSRNNDTAFKRNSALFFYHLVKKMGLDMIENHSEFRLMSKRTVEALSSFSEINLFLRGIVPMIGFKSINVYYDRNTREAGESKYNFTKLMSLAWQAITSFSVAPLRLITVVGFVIFLFSLLLASWVLYNKFIAQTTVSGWASTVLLVSFFGGVQLLGIGIIGEYIGKIYQEVKRRPRYFVDKVI